MEETEWDEDSFKQSLKDAIAEHDDEWDIQETRSFIFKMMSYCIIIGSVLMAIGGFLVVFGLFQGLGIWATIGVFVFIGGMLTLLLGLIMLKAKKDVYRPEVEAEIKTPEGMGTPILERRITSGVRFIVPRKPWWDLDVRNVFWVIIAIFVVMGYPIAIYSLFTQDWDALVYGSVLAATGTYLGHMLWSSTKPFGYTIAETETGFYLVCHNTTISGLGLIMDMAWEWTICFEVQGDDVVFVPQKMMIPGTVVFRSNPAEKEWFIGILRKNGVREMPVAQVPKDPDTGWFDWPAGSGPDPVSDVGEPRDDQD